MPNHYCVPKVDPRIYQIIILLLLVFSGLLFFEMDIQLGTAVVLISSALACQFILTKVFKYKQFRPESALISALSLCLLLRTDTLVIAAFAALLAISSKFLICSGGRHIFNPTNFALVFLLAFTDSAWVSPGQWGSVALFGFFIAGLGGLVLYRSERSDITITFLILYAGMLFGRALWLGDPLSIPWLYLQNGGLLIFAFLMLSDPKTIPDARIGRLLFAAIVAGLAIYFQFYLYNANGLLWALALAAPLNPLFNYFFPASSYQWQSKRNYYEH